MHSLWTCLLYIHTRRPVNWFCTWAVCVGKFDVWFKVWGGGYGAFHEWLVVRATGAQLHSSANGFISTVHSCVFVCACVAHIIVFLVCFAARCTFKILHCCCKGFSSSIASFLASLSSASMQIECSGQREFCLSLVAWVDILIAGCVLWSYCRCVCVCFFS